MTYLQQILNLEEAVRAIKNGDIIIVKTDTLYGLLADATNQRAINQVYHIKGRATTKSLPLFFASIEAVKRYTLWSVTAEKLARRFWPGPLTMVLPMRTELRQRSGGEHSGGGSTEVWQNGATIAARVPDVPAIINLLSEIKTPVTGTSANISGLANPRSIEEVAKQFAHVSGHLYFWQAQGHVISDCFIDNGNRKEGRADEHYESMDTVASSALPSTIVKVYIDNDSVLAKAGAIDVNSLPKLAERGVTASDDDGVEQSAAAASFNDIAILRHGAIPEQELRIALAE